MKLTERVLQHLLATRGRWGFNDSGGIRKDMGPLELPAITGSCKCPMESLLNRSPGEIGLYTLGIGPASLGIMASADNAGPKKMEHDKYFDPALRARMLEAAGLEAAGLEEVEA